MKIWDLDLGELNGILDLGEVLREFVCIFVYLVEGLKRFAFVAG